MTHIIELNITVEASDKDDIARLIAALWNERVLLRWSTQVDQVEIVKVEVAQ